jgi:hypothetical protein
MALYMTPDYVFFLTGDNTTTSITIDMGPYIKTNATVVGANAVPASVAYVTLTNGNPSPPTISASLFGVYAVLTFSAALSSTPSQWTIHLGLNFIP